MSRNFGWGSRDMQDAARMAMQATMPGQSSVATHAERFGQFKDFAKENGVGRMERIDRELVREYGQTLADKVDAGELTAAYAQNLISSVNTAMRCATRGEWRSVSPTKECNIPQRDNIRTNPTVERSLAERSISELDARGAAIASLAQDLGLRSKEAALLDAKTALSQAIEKGVVALNDGTKGGRFREIPITHERQIATLERAAEVQGDNRAVMPADQNWKEYRGGDLRDTREALQNATGSGLHDLRAAYAAERYQAITGHPAPCNGGKIEDRQLDREAREQIATELGHGRIDVLANYIGGR